MFFALVACTAADFEGGTFLPPVDAPVVAHSDLDDLANAQRFDLLLPEAAAVDIRCVLMGDDTEVHTAQGASDRLHQIDLVGLLADEEYSCTLTSGTWSQVEDVRTPPFPDWIPDWEVSVPGPAWGDYLLLNHSNGEGKRQAKLMIIDRDGRLRWYKRIAEDPPDLDAQYIGAGMVLYGGGYGVRPTLIDLSHERILYAPEATTGLDYHHHTERVETGEVLTLVEATNATADDEWLGFGIEILDPSLERATWAWNSQRGVDEGWLPVPAADNDDPYHANAAALQDGAVYVGLRGESELHKIDRDTGGLLWTLGAGGDFELLNDDGTPADDSQWFYGAHAPEIDGSTVLVYDNGYLRPDGSWSRVVELELDEAARTATIVWTYTEAGWYEPIWGDVDRLDNGHVLVARPHCVACGTHPAQRTEVFEVDPITNEVVWRITFADEVDAGYRAQAIAGCDLFANARYCP